MENIKKGGMKYNESDDLLEKIESEHAVCLNNTPVKLDAFELLIASTITGTAYRRD